MTNKIIEVISKTLGEVFGEDIKIYRKKLEQGFEKPCFFITCISTSNKQIIGPRYNLSHSFDIQYYPGDGESNVESIVEQLYTPLEYISIDEMSIRGSKMNYKMEDGIIHFYIDYNIQIIKESTEDSMDGLVINSGGKG